MTSYNSNVRTLTPKDDAILSNGIIERFKFCIEHDLITYVVSHDSQRAKDEIVITPDIFEELRHIKIESLTNLKDLASMIGGEFESCTRKISGINTKVAAGPASDFKTFLLRKIEDSNDEKS